MIHRDEPSSLTCNGCGLADAPTGPTVGSIATLRVRVEHGRAALDRMGRVLKPATRFRIGDPLLRVMTWRAKGLSTRAAQAVLVAGLAWLATAGSMLVWVWLAINLICGFADSSINRWLLQRRQARSTLTIACVSYGVCILAYLSLIGVLLADPTPARIAEIGLLLCASCLNNAMMSAGSPLATGVLVGPPTALLMASPMMARLAGMQIGLADSLLLGVAGGIFTAFIVRLAASIDAEGAGSASGPRRTGPSAP